VGVSRQGGAAPAQRLAAAVAARGGGLPETPLTGARSIFLYCVWRGPATGAEHTRTMDKMWSCVHV